MVVQHNIPSLNAHRNLLVNNSATAKNLEKLSSGFRINRAGDDAAGLAISEKMRAQIRGLAMAEQNANNGISLIQTGEGGLNETHAILQRMRELAVQASNGTYQTEDRKQINLEIDALKSEINRIATATNYNKINLLDGTTGGREFGTAAAAGAAGSPVSWSLDYTSLTALDGLFGLSSPNEFGDIAAAKHSGAGNLDFTFTLDGTTLTITDSSNNTVTWNTGDSDIDFTSFGGVKITLDSEMTQVLDDIEASGVGGVVTFGLTIGNAPGGVTLVANSAKQTFTVKSTYSGGNDELAGINIDSGTSAITWTSALGLDNNTFTFFTDGASWWAKDETTGQVVEDGGGGVFTFTAGAITLGGLLSTGSESGSFTVTLDASGSVTLDGTTATGIKTTAAPANAPANNAAIIADMFTAMGLDESWTLTLDAAADDLFGENAYMMTRGEGAGKELILVVGDNYYTLENGTTFQDKDGNTVATLSSAWDNTAGDGVIKFTLAGDDTAVALSDLAGGMIATSDTNLIFQIGANGTADQRVGLHVDNMSSFALGSVAAGNYVADIDITTVEGARAAIEVVNDAIMQVSAQRAQLGALQNRLEHTVNNLSVTRENLTAAESTIRDVDMAKEMMEFTKNSILVQASQAMLAQANALPQGILSLLR